jgi:putative PIN family toxin of toxin-antitoxin system
MRIVLDTNVLMSGIFFGGAPGKILRAWQAGQIALAASPEIVEEYVATADVLSARYVSVHPEPILSLIVKNSELWKSPALTGQVCSDPDDDKFLACALASDAACIVSGDKALRRVSGYRGIVVVSPRQFVDEHLERMEQGWS